MVGDNSNNIMGIINNDAGPGGEPGIIGIDNYQEEGDKILDLLGVFNHGGDQQHLRYQQQYNQIK